ncbi:MAG: NADH-quinone oxidoreductase subunit N [Deltaproteobacteria bacterium]|nr:NADH-quinone oxidoreductase subunit N [Deltaproteobacteria bacterium]
MSAHDLAALVPLVILTVTGALCLLLEVTGVPVGARKLAPRSHIVWCSELGLAATALVLLRLFARADQPALAFAGALRLDRFGLGLGLVVCVAAALAIPVAVGFLRSRDLDRGEYYATVVFAALGMIALALAADLVFLFVALETTSVAVYILAGIDRRSSRSPEAALKYFLNGAFASGILLFGVALCYGATRSTAIGALGPALRGGDGALLASAGLLLVLVGLGFKVAAAPFHMWAADAYDGAPAPASAFMATAVKAAAFAALIRVSVNAQIDAGSGWISAGWIIAVATMTVGNLAALAQRRVKRMLAYSSIAHAGYALGGVVAAIGGHTPALGAVGFYLLAYTLMTTGAFGVAAFFERADGAGCSHDEWAGAATRFPLVSLAMAIFLFSLAGVPPTAGFLAKLNLFACMIDGGFYWLAFVGVLNSLLSVYYYLRVLVFMYMRDPDPQLAGHGGAFVGAGLAIAALAVLLVGLLPGTMLDLAAQLRDVAPG